VQAVCCCACAYRLCGLAADVGQGVKLLPATALSVFKGRRRGGLRTVFFLKKSELRKSKSGVPNFENRSCEKLICGVFRSMNKE
jgi:hypothetical protein